MDISLARTFLTVAETGSFIDAARRMNVTQSTVSARIKSLEDLLGRPLFDRSHNGAVITPAGEQFRKHALALVRVWQHARLEVGISSQHRDHLAVGAPQSFWDGFLVKWVGSLRKAMADIAVSGTAASASYLTQRLVEGTLDLAILYRPAQPPGLIIEHLFDDEMVLVTSMPEGARMRNADYVFIDWGSDFQQDHAAAFPDLATSGLHLDIGPAGVDYLVAHETTGYVPLRLVRAGSARRKLRLVKRARRFVYPVYMVYPEARDEEAYEPILDSLRRLAQTLG